MEVGVIGLMAGLDMGGRKGASTRCLLFGVSREVVREAGVAVHKPAPESDVDPCAGIEATVPMPGKFRRNYIVPTPGFGSVQLVNVGRTFWTPDLAIQIMGYPCPDIRLKAGSSHVSFAPFTLFLFQDSTSYKHASRLWGMTAGPIATECISEDVAEDMVSRRWHQELTTVSSVTTASRQF